MGHYYAEMFPNGEDRNLKQRRVRYQQACAREIEEIVSKNPIKFEEIKLGEKLSLYTPLKSLSKIRFDNEGEFHLIREAFQSFFGYYGREMWNLSWKNNFFVYDLRKEDSCVRISELPKDSFDLFPVWVGTKYFEKIVPSQ